MNVGNEEMMGRGFSDRKPDIILRLYNGAGDQLEIENKKIKAAQFKREPCAALTFLYYSITILPHVPAISP